MPKTLQAFTYLVPARYYLIVLRGILLKAGGIRELWPQAIFLTLYAVLALSFAVVKFPRRLS
jgi:ABC-2 type transport system permease protein